MRRFTVFAVVVLVVALALPALGAPSRSDALRNDRLQMYYGTVTAQQAERLRLSGHELLDLRRAKGGRFTVELVLSGMQRDKLASQGLKFNLVDSASDQRISALAEPYTVYRSYSEPGGIRDELEQLAADHPDLVTLHTIGHSIQGKPIYALQVTAGRRGGDDDDDDDDDDRGSRNKPSVLYVSLQHAREWISVEVNRRLLHYFVDNYGTNAEVTRLVNNNELWFVVVANPDGYDYTFTEGNRLWRKNLRDNDGDGQITVLDGVDLNRNFPTKWGYDNEGSSPIPSSETYRGTAPASEPETQALDRLMRRERFDFLVNYHSAAELLLYGIGWQVATPSPDDVVYKTLAGDDARPAIPGYDPDLSAELYITNGETTDHAHSRYGTLAFTPELSSCDGECGFEFPDDEALIQAEFERNLPFALDVAKSAKDPANPFSHLGNKAPNFVVDTFSVSYGSPQIVEATVAREMGQVRLRYRINGGKVRSTNAREWHGGERYGGTNDVYYRDVRGKIRGLDEGDKVKAWFTAKGRRSAKFKFTVVSDTNADVLVLAAEDYTGTSPVQGVTSPKYLDEYTAALEANDISYDVYNLDESGATPDQRKAPHPLGVLSHYDAVVWYTGDDTVLRDGNETGIGVSELQHELQLAVRDYLNEGGKLLYAGKNAGLAEAFGLWYGTNGAPETPCTSDDPLSDCLQLSNDFHQYYLGAYIISPFASGEEVSPVQGVDTPFKGMRWELDGPNSAQNQAGFTSSLVPTSNLLPPDEFPQFESWRSALWEFEGPDPFSPFTGQWMLYSQQADVAYKRVSRTVDLTGASTASLSFRTSYDTEPEWDFLFVEARPVGTNDWTTLPDANGHTSQETGASCPEGWAEELHPHLVHYQTVNPDGTCSPTGTTGEWHATSGASTGWEQWNIDLSAYAGEQVEVSIAYVSDWATQGLGVNLDDLTVSVGGTTVTTTSFETDLGGWTVTGPPAGTEFNATDWIRTQRLYEVAAAVTTEDTIYLGFGLEGVNGAATRAAIMRRAMNYLLP